MENAVDAGARSVSVVVRDGGKSVVQVIDDGCGMAAEDAVVCFARHATSKIRESGDLFALRTFGFRGEALASIADSYTHLRAPDTSQARVWPNVG